MAIRCLSDGPSRGTQTTHNWFIILGEFLFCLVSCYSQNLNPIIPQIRVILVFEIAQCSNLFCELPVILWHFTTYKHPRTLGLCVTKVTNWWRLAAQIRLCNGLRLTWTKYLGLLFQTTVWIILWCGTILVVSYETLWMCFFLSNRQYMGSSIWHRNLSSTVHLQPPAVPPHATEWCCRPQWLRAEMPPHLVKSHGKVI